MAGDASIMMASKSGLIDDSLTSLTWLSNLNVARSHCVSTSSSSSISPATSKIQLKKSKSQNSGSEKMAKEKDLVNEIISRNISGNSRVEKENIGDQVITPPLKRPNNPVRNISHSDGHASSKDTKRSIVIEPNEPESKRVRTATRKNIFIEIVKEKFHSRDKPSSSKTTGVHQITEASHEQTTPIFNSIPLSSTQNSHPSLNSSSIINASSKINASDNFFSHYDFETNSLFEDEDMKHLGNDASTADSHKFVPDFYTTFQSEETSDKIITCPNISQNNNMTKSSNDFARQGGIYLDTDKLLEQFEAETKAFNDKESISNNGYNLDVDDLNCDFNFPLMGDKNERFFSDYSSTSSLDLMVQGTALKVTDSCRDAANLPNVFCDQMSPLNCTIGDPFDGDIGFDLRLNQQTTDDGSYEVTGWINEHC